MVKKIVQSGNF